MGKKPEKIDSIVASGCSSKRRFNENKIAICFCAENVRINWSCEVNLVLKERRGVGEGRSLESRPYFPSNSESLYFLDHLTNHVYFFKKHFTNHIFLNYKKGSLAD